jgi:hypothetical protein
VGSYLIHQIKFFFMAFTQGLQTINFLGTTQSTNTNITPADVTGFSFLVQAAKRIEWEVEGIFSTGATGGFRFLAHNTSAPTTYNAEFTVVDITTPATFVTVQTTEAAFTNASAVATNYLLSARGFVLANAATTFSFQFAQNNSTGNNISMLAGMVFKLWQL